MTKICWSAWSAGAKALWLAGLLLSARMILPAQSATITEYPIPSGTGAITAGPDGALWFTESSGNKIGRITTAGVVTEYLIPTASSSPQAITAGPDGALWFTESSGNKIGRISTAGVIAEFALPTAKSSPDAITAGPDGALWFTESPSLGSAGDRYKIGRITVAGSIAEYAAPTTGFGLGGITAGPDGALWFTDTGGRIGRITTAGSVTFYPLPLTYLFPIGITAGPDGALWFTEAGNSGPTGKIGRITTTGVITEYASKSQPEAITAGPDSALWFGDTGQIGRITTAGVITFYPAQALRSPFAIAAGPDGALWFAEGSKIGRLLPPPPPPPAPLVTIAGVFNNASGASAVTGGSWVSIYGSNLSATTRSWQSSDFLGLGNNLPIKLDGVSVTINSKSAAVEYISPGLINVQAPDDSSTGPVQVQVTNSLGTATGTATLQTYAPGFFAIQGKYVAAVHTDGVYVAPADYFGSAAVSRAAQPGETLLLYGTGFGPTTPAIGAAQIVTSAAPLTDPSQLHIRIGGVAATVQYAGIVAAGEYQFNVVVPPLPDGDQSIIADIGGVSTQSGLLISIKN